MAQIRVLTRERRLERSFDLLDYRVTRAGPSVARKTVDNFLEKASRLHEQECCAALAATALVQGRARNNKGLWLSARDQRSAVLAMVRAQVYDDL
jgi:hypothetical protein